MRAVVFDQFRAVPEVRTVPDPAPARGGVIIDVAATGLCRSDWHGWMGHDPDIRLPHVPGHEFAGTVSAVGADVHAWTVGDRVTVPFGCACGTCAACSRGDQQVCEIQTQPGFTHWGSFAEFVAIDHADINLVRLPDELPFDTAAALGCRFATSFRAITTRGAVRAGEWVAVHGCGGVGLSAVMIAAAAGARVIAVDITTQTLDLARECGATVCLNATQPQPIVSTIRELTGGGAHVSVDALGTEETCDNSIECLRRRGRHVQLGWFPEGAAQPRVPMGRVMGYELELLGSHGMAAHAYPEMLSLVTSGLLQPARLVTDVIGLESAATALTTMDRATTAGISLIRPR